VFINSGAAVEDAGAGLHYYESAAARDAAVIAVGSTLMIAAAVFQAFDAAAIIMTAVLRGAGDTLIPSIASGVSNWVLIMGVGFFCITFFPQMGALGPFLGAVLFCIAIGLFTTLRFHAGGWRSRSVVRDD